MKPKDQPKCMNRRCRSRGKSAAVKYRGLCDACYRSLMRLISAGKITMEEAESRGLCKAPVPAGSRRWPLIAGSVERQADRGLVHK